ncbi:MAG: single-stranded-DNA-specific exonuclease RecJ [Anaerolineae bacterium]|nr:single-stranded-DNA-specific exonuclease RecJ [Anaerolineae bacterium]
MTIWIDPEPVDVPDGVLHAAGSQMLVAQTLVRRGIRTAEAARAFLDPAAYTPASPLDLPDLDLAVERIRRAIDRGETVAVWGDFDADGQTATALLLEALRAAGAEAIFHVPGRSEGHGVHHPGVQHLVQRGARLIVTVDTGVTAHRALAYAVELGADTIVTDHHVPGEALPDAALAVINPHRLPADHALAHLTGVGVAHALASVLAPAAARAALDLVALGTVADVGLLQADNRYLVQRGLQALRDTARPGLLALYQAAGLAPGGLAEDHVGFVLGPRLNALGRLADASAGVELLTTGDELRARILATEMEGLNARRQWLTKQVADAALAQIQRNPALLHDYHVLLLSHPAWPPGILGIVAGRLAERFGKPAVLVATPAGQIARGSGRSVAGVDLVAGLQACAGLLEEFGGHPGAAGLSVEAERLATLRGALSRALAPQVAAAPERALQIDATVDIPDLTLDLVAATARLAPFGRGNPALTLAVRDVRVLSDVPIGRTEEHRRVTIEDAHDHALTVFWWQGAGWLVPRGRFDLAVTVRTSDYRGLPELQVEWVDAWTAEAGASAAAVEIPAGPAFQVHDYRVHPQPLAMLRALAPGQDGSERVLVWAEGNVPEGIVTHTRRELVPAARLALWTLPPGPRELAAALEQVAPEQVFLFAADAGLDEAGAFLARLGGMVRYVLRAKDGVLDPEAAAAHLGHRVATVEAGIAWLAAGGQVGVIGCEESICHLAHGTGSPVPTAVDEARRRLEALLAETAAYRAYLRTAPAASLAR